MRRAAPPWTHFHELEVNISVPNLGRWSGRGGELVSAFARKKTLSCSTYLWNTFWSVNAHTPLNIIYFQLQIVLIPGKMDLKFTEMNATEMYVVNLKSHIIAFHSFSLYLSLITPPFGYLLVRLQCNSRRLKLPMKFIMALIKAVMLVSNSEFHLSTCSFWKQVNMLVEGFAFAPHWFIVILHWVDFFILNWQDEVIRNG